MRLHRRSFVILTTLVTLVSAGRPRAQEPTRTLPAIVRLTLAEALARGAAESHRLQEFEARRAAAEAAVAGREAADRPHVTAIGTYTRTNHIEEFGLILPTGQRRIIFPDIPDNYRTRLDVQWPIFTAGRTAALTNASRREVEALGSDLAAARQDLRLEITRAYWSIVTLTEAVRVVEAGTRRMDAHLDEARSRLDAGLIPPNEVLSVEAQRARQEVALVEARNARAVAMADLRRLIDAPDTADVVPADALEPLPAAPPAFDVLMAGARQARSERQALSRRVGAAHARVDAARATDRPTVAIAGGVDYARPNPRILPRRNEWDPSWDLSVNATWSLWDGGRTRAQVAEADATRRAAEQRLEEFDSLLELDVRQRRLDLEAALAAVAAAGEAVRSAAEARRVVAERFRAGVATSLEVLDAQVALLQAELDRTRAYATVHLAAARLERAVGR